MWVVISRVPWISVHGRQILFLLSTKIKISVKMTIHGVKYRKGNKIIKLISSPVTSQELLEVMLNIPIFLQKHQPRKYMEKVKSMFYTWLNCIKIWVKKEPEITWNSNALLTRFMPKPTRCCSGIIVCYKITKEIASVN